MVRLSSRLGRLQTRLPPPPPAHPIPDYGRLTPGQRMRLAALSERYQAVGTEGLTAAELEGIAGLVGILERGPAP